MKQRHRSQTRQRGATAVEFALVLLVFLTFLLGVIDISRMLFTWNAASEATRAGARYAVVCADATRNADVLARMQAVVPQIRTIEVDWAPGNCTPPGVTGPDPCEGVSVRVTGLNYQWISPIGTLTALPSFPMPGFSTSLPTEIMRRDPNSGALCQR